MADSVSGSIPDAPMALAAAYSSASTTDAPPSAKEPRRTGSITDVAGLRVGHFTDSRRPTGCTVVLTTDGAVGGVDVRGAAPGTRETELLSPLNSVKQVHAVLLSGGSAFGLDAASGVMRWLDERGIGVSVSSGPAAVGVIDAAGSAIPKIVHVPIVSAAILFDLFVGDPSIRPDAQAGYAACEAACEAASTTNNALPPAEGNVGAGAGASVGKLFGMARAMRGGIGTASAAVCGFTVGALVAVNAVGDVIDPATGQIVAGARTADGSALLNSMQALLRGELPAQMQPGQATTLGVVATDALLTKAEANKMAQMAHDGLARSINPVHTLADGDTVFALATGASGLTASVSLLGAVAAEVLALAVLRAVRAAKSLDQAGLPHLPAAHEFAP